MTSVNHAENSSLTLREAPVFGRDLCLCVENAVPNKPPATNKRSLMSSFSPSGVSQSALPGPRPVGFRAHAFRKGLGNPKAVNFSSIAQTQSDPSEASASVPTNLRNAPPMKKRAKGSGFIGLLFLTGLAAVGYFIWTSLLQFQAYGMIEGRLISVAAPWDGTVVNWQVRGGDEVTQGQILGQISNLEMEHELASLCDDLKMNQALLDAEISKIKFDIQNQSERSQKAVAEYLETYGELLAESDQLKELDRTFERTKRLVDSNAVSRSEYDKAFYQVAGQKKKIEKLQAAVEVLKIRSIEFNSAHDDGSSRLKPILARIELTQSKIARVRERIDQGKIQAPVSGRVSKRHCLTGESAKSGETVIEILEDNSIEAVLYVPQRIVDEFRIGNRMEIRLEPYHQSLQCTIVRFGNRFETAPESIEGYYFENQPLLPVYLAPGPEASQTLELRVGSIVKRPYEYLKALTKMTQQTTRSWQSSNSESGSEPVIRQETPIMKQNLVSPVGTFGQVISDNQPDQNIVEPTASSF